MRTNQTWLYGLLVVFGLGLAGADCEQKMNVGETDDAGQDGGVTSGDTWTDGGETTGGDAGDTGVAPDTAADDDGGGGDTGTGTDTGSTMADAGDTATGDGGDTDRDTDVGSCESDEHEPNDTRSASTQLPQHGLGMGGLDAVACSGDTDWYDYSFYSPDAQFRDGAFVEASVVHEDMSADLTVELMRETRGGSMTVVETADRKEMLEIPTNPNRPSERTDAIRYSIRHQTDRSRQGPYYVKVSGADSPTAYSVYGYHRGPGRADVDCESDTYEPNEDESSAAVLQAPTSQDKNKLRDLRLCDGDKDVYEMTVPPGNTYHLGISHLASTKARLSAHTASGKTLDIVRRWQPLHEAWAHMRIGSPADGEDTVVYITVETLDISPYVGEYRLTINHKR